MIRPSALINIQWPAAEDYPLIYIFIGFNLAGGPGAMAARRGAGLDPVPVVTSLPVSLGHQAAGQRPPHRPILILPTPGFLPVPSRGCPSSRIPQLEEGALPWGGGAARKEVSVLNRDLTTRTCGVGGVWAGSVKPGQFQGTGRIPAPVKGKSIWECPGWAVESEAQPQQRFLAAVQSQIPTSSTPVWVRSNSSSFQRVTIPVD